MLSQVRAAAVGQIICVWVGKSKTFVRFVVDSIELPNQSDDVPVVRLTANTEVIIAPKSRALPEEILPSTDAVSTSKVAPMQRDALARLKTRLFRNLPRELISSLPELSNISASETTAYVGPPLFSVLAAAYPSFNCALTLHDLPRKVTLSRPSKSRPQPQSETDEPGVSSSTLHKASTFVKPSGKSPAVQVEFRCARGVPVNHVYLSDAIRKELGLHCADGRTPFGAGYELVRFVTCF